MQKVLILDDLVAAQTWLADAVLMVCPTATITCYDRLIDAIHWLTDNNPTLCLVDLMLPDGSGIELIKACKKLTKPPAILVVTMFDDDQHLLPALQAGADGYLLKEEPKATLAHGISVVLGKQPILSAQITQRLIQLVQEIKPANNHTICPLTIREQDILRAIAKGYQTTEVAHLLNISPHTAAKHLKNIYTKLGIHSRAQAVHEAMRFGILKIDTSNIHDAIEDIRE